MYGQLQGSQIHKNTACVCIESAKAIVYDQQEVMAEYYIKFSSQPAKWNVTLTVKDFGNLDIAIASTSSKNYEKMYF